MSAQTATPAPAQQPHRTPKTVSWFQRMTSTFPLTTYDSVPVLAPVVSSRLPRPVLYVAEGHPLSRHAASSQPSTSAATGWASRDPRCLAWQMQLLFRGVSFDCLSVPEDDVTSAAYPGEGLAQVPVLLDTDGTVVGRRQLAHWADTVQPYSSDVSSSVALSSEAQAIETLLQGPLMAGVLLELLLLPTPSAMYAHLPTLTGQMQQSLVRQRKGRLATKIAALLHVSPTTRVPGWTTSLHGLLNMGQGGFADTGTAAADGADDDDEFGGALNGYVDADRLDQGAIVRDACDALQAIALLLPSDATWICEAGPSHLDALLFAHLHTIMSLPVPDNEKDTAFLRQVVEASPELTAYTRRIWRDYVKEKGG